MRADNRSTFRALLGSSFAILTGIGLAAAMAQQTAPDRTPQFDVASVKPSAPRITGRKGPRPFTTDPTRLAARGLTLKRLISYAYSLDEFRVTSGPAWTDNERYDIDAKTEKPVAADEMMLMLRALLADRYQLKFHRETKPIPQNLLVLAKNGPKYGPHFHLVQDGTPPVAVDKMPGQIPLKGKTMKDLAFFLTENQHMWDPDNEDGAGPPVIDQTGLAGVYDIVLTFASRRDWLAVFEQDLGLKVEARKVAAEIFVIESAARPAAN